MSTANDYSPSRDDFAALLEDSFTRHEAYEGTVVKGTVVAIEKDVAVIDVGMKTEGRVALREFMGPGRDQPLKVGDIVEVPDERALHYLRLHYAEPVVDLPEERAVAPKGEERTTRRRTRKAAE